MRSAAIVTYTVAGLAVAGLVALAAPPIVAAITPPAHPVRTAASAPETTPAPTVTPSPPDQVIWLGEDDPVKVSDFPKGCTTHTTDGGPVHGRLIGEPHDRGPSPGATGTVNRDAEGNIVSFTAAPGDDAWSIGDRLCSVPSMVAWYNHIGSDRGDHDLQPGETVMIHPNMNVERLPPGS